MNRCILFVVLQVLTGCSTAPKLPERVLVPVPVACVKEAPAVPTLRSEAEILAMDDYAATIVTYGERLELRAYAEKASVLIAACK